MAHACPLGKRAGPLIRSTMSGLSGESSYRMFYVYVLKSRKDSRFYTGFSADLKSRVEAHSAGKVEITKDRRPMELVYYEAFKYELDARRQELFYKTGQGRRILKARLVNVIEEKLPARQASGPAHE